MESVPEELAVKPPTAISGAVHDDRSIIAISELNSTNRANTEFPEANSRASAFDPFAVSSLCDPRSEEIIMAGNDNLHKIPAFSRTKSVEVQENVAELVVSCNLKE